MKQRTLFLALLAGFAVGCSSSSDTATSAQSDIPKPTDTVAAAGGTATSPVEGGQAATPEPSVEAASPTTTKPAETAKPATTGDRAAAAPTQGAQGGADGLRAEQRGAQPGGQGGRQGGRGFNMGMMLRSDQFKTELKLTADQVTKLEAAMPQQGQGGGQDATPEERAKQRAEVEKKVQAILKPEQQARIKQIELQMRGARALTREDVAKELGLSADQSKKIEAALDVQRPEGGDRDAFMKLREEAGKKALGLLTPAQKTQWEKMLGKPFVFQRPQGGGGMAGIT